MKICTKCGVEKPEDAFAMQPSRGRRRAECRECKAKSDKAWLEKRKVNPPQQKVEMKCCNTCHQVKPISEFSPGAPGYFHGRCKKCETEIHHKKRQEQYQDDPQGRFYWPFMNEEGIIVKRCTCCYAEKPLSEFYTNRKGGKGHHGKCKECDKAMKKADYDAHPEKYRKAVRISARKYPEKQRARHSRWRSAHHERCLRYYSQYHEIHREQQCAYARMRHIQNAEQEILYRIAHRFEAAERAQRRRAREQNAPRIERIDRRAIIERDQWTCYLCGQVCTPKNVTLDHVIPLFHGGSHTADNLRVACLSCNCRKGHKLNSHLLISLA